MGTGRSHRMPMTDRAAFGDAHPALAQHIFSTEPNFKPL
jgi:hypothetical protein